MASAKEGTAHGRHVGGMGMAVSVSYSLATRDFQSKFRYSLAEIVQLSRQEAGGATLPPASCRLATKKQFVLMSARGMARDDKD